MSDDVFAGVLDTGTAKNGDQPVETSAIRPLRFVGIKSFANAGTEAPPAILGSRDDRDVLLGADSDALIWGDGGEGKTVLVTDLALHLAAGVDWYGVHVDAPVNLLIVENEGDRGEFEEALRERLAAWDGDGRPIADAHVQILSDPWAEFSLEHDLHRQQLAAHVIEHEIAVVVIGPGAESGMVGSGTPEDVSMFNLRVRQFRQLVGRPVAVLVIHHENKAGDVSGAWTRWPAWSVRVTLDVDKRRTEVEHRKARSSSKRNRTKMLLGWGDTESHRFTLIEVDDSAGPRKAGADAIQIWIRHDCGGRATPKQIRDQFEIGDDTLRRRRPDLHKLGVVYIGDGKAAEYVDREIHPALIPDEPPQDRSQDDDGIERDYQADPATHPRTKIAGSPIAGSDPKTMRDRDPRTPHPAIQPVAGSGKRAEQGKDEPPHPALPKEGNPPVAGSGDSPTQDTEQTPDQDTAGRGSASSSSSSSDSGSAARDVQSDEPHLDDGEPLL